MHLTFLLYIESPMVELETKLCIIGCFYSTYIFYFYFPPALSYGLAFKKSILAQVISMRGKVWFRASESRQGCSSCDEIERSSLK